MIHIADNHDALLDYLYEEGDPAERLTIAKHLQECAACSVAVLEFQNVRGMLRDWSPPVSDLGVRVVKDASPGAPVTSPSATVDRGARDGRSWGWGSTTSRRMPWLQAAAAILLFASGMAVSQLDVDYGNGTLTVRTRSAAPAPAANVRNVSIMLPSRDVSSQPVASVQPSSNDTELLLQRVRAMIDQSEQRQQRELALRLSQVTREVDTQHQADLLKIQQDFGQQQAETMEYLVRTSGGLK